MTSWLLAPMAGAEAQGLNDLIGGGGSRQQDSPDTGSSSAADDPGDMYHEAYFKIDRLNVGLPPLDDPPDLQTPRTSLENFVDSCEAGDYRRAAHSLNLNGLSPEKQAELGRTYARMLKRVIDQKIWFTFQDIPDRPDGVDDSFSLKDEAGGQSRDGPRRKVELGRVDVDGRTVDLWLQRVKVPREQPVWVFAQQTVDRVPMLYEAYGPSDLERRMPGFLQSELIGRTTLWQALGLVLFLAVGIGIGWLIQWLAERMLRDAPSYWATNMARSARWPMAITLGLIFFYILSSQLLRLAGPVMMVLEPLVILLIVLGITWTTSRLISTASDMLCSRYTTDEVNAQAQSRLTQVKVARHVLTVLVIVIGLCIALSQFEWFRALGTILLTSAAVGAAILGLAAQRSLGNIFAGIQLAVTQPVRVGEAVIFEKEFGWIEEIAITYIVIRTWDLRRLVLPTAYFLDVPIENWTRTGENMMKPVYIYADYRVDVDAVRAELGKILDDHEDWDHAVPPILQVTSCSEHAVELRALCSAKDPATAWNLHCDVRERLLAFLHDLEGGKYLPRDRILVDGRLDRDDDSDARQDGSDGKGRPRGRKGRSTRSNKSRAGAGGRQPEQTEVTHESPEEAEGK